MGYTRDYKIALRSRFYQNMVKWINNRGAKRVYSSLFVFLTGLTILLYNTISNFFEGQLQTKSSSWIDQSEVIINVTAIGVIFINTIAWAISEFKFNVIFITQLILLAGYASIFYSEVFLNATFLPIFMMIMSIIVILLPKETKRRLYGSASEFGGYFVNPGKSKSHSSRRSSSGNERRSSGRRRSSSRNSGSRNKSENSDTPSSSTSEN
jgi:hypothetical protein